MKVLITGGAGYIGSTIASSLIDNGHMPIILDSLITGKEEFVRGREFYKGDITDKNVLNKIFKDHPEIEICIHCAGLIVVPDSVNYPYVYYRENVSKSLELFNNLKRIGCKKIIFSSSASVYDINENFEVNEYSSINPTSPYAHTKVVIERILKDFCNAHGMQVIIFRYFNPIGADPKMRSGVHIKNPSHVLGKLIEVAMGREPFFQITGVDYNTRDGSGVRDYFHVWDLAQAHLLAVKKFDYVINNSNSNYEIINLGTGNGVTVKELVFAFEIVYGKKINKKEAPRRIGDVAGAFTNNYKAKKLLDWENKLSLEDGIRDALLWEENKRETLSI